MSGRVDAAEAEAAALRQQLQEALERLRALVVVVEADVARQHAERERWLRWAARRTCCEAGLVLAPEPCPWHDASGAR